MKKNKNHKNKLINKIIYICFLLFITTIFLGEIAGFDISNSIERKLTVNSISDKNMQPDIRILEIEPGDSFKLTSNTNTRVVSGIETIEDFKGYKIEITHMTMAEFIGKIEQINGKYDVIVIGRYIDTSLTGPNGTVDYSKIKYDKISIKSDLKNKSWFNDYAHLQNDITNKKAKEIREFIQSGQLVYIDITIGDNSNNNPDKNNPINLDWTKLYYHLTNSEGDFFRGDTWKLNNFIRDKKITELKIDDILNKYIEQSNKNLTKQVIHVTSPKGDTLGTLGDVNKRNMTFNITSKKPQNEELTINLYLDINGDGLFKEDEKVKTVNGVNLSNGDYELQYNIYEDYPQFIGYLDWKIEAIKNNNGYTIPIKSHYDGNITFTRLEGEDKRIINVLQISPFTRDKLDADKSSGNAGWDGKQGANLNLAQNKEFKKLLTYKEVSDYDIKIDVISYQDFYQGNSYGPGKENLNKSKYDMIIMGFSDVYPEESISEEAVNQLKEYVKAGKSLMLTHDTLTYWKAWDGLENASKLMKTFRDVSGQSRYIDKFNSEETDFNGNKIVHDVNKPTDNDKKENGSTFFNMYKGVDANSTESNQVYRINKTVVTSYPFEITGNEIRVRETHGQYFQLNLEDEDTVPILNLTENNTESGKYTNNISFNNKYDSRNFYYTYSRGNITFSGTGENARETNEYPPSEMQLFINTIVKAERSANHKPIISGLSDDKAAEVSFNNDFNFDIVVKDPDRDKVKINSIIVNGEDISSINNLSNEYKDSGTSYSLKISKDILSKYINKEITVKIEAEDERKAISIKEYKIKVVSDAIIVQKTVKKRLVINEEESFIIDLETENDSNPTSIIIDDNITNPEIEGIFGIEGIKAITENGKLKLEIKNLVAYQKEKGREINIPLSYITSGNKKNVIIKIIYDSDYIRTELPDITAELTSAKTIEVNDDNSKEITLEYTIKPQSFTTDVLKTQGAKIEEVIFIVDLSNKIDKNNTNTWDAIRNGLSNSFYNDQDLNSYKFAAIGYNDKIFVSDLDNKTQNSNISIKNISSTEFSKLINPFYGNYNGTKDKFYQTFREDSYLRSHISNNEIRNIDGALILATKIFDNFGEEGKGKAIVLVNTGSVNYSKEEVDRIKSKGYRIISIDLSGNDSGNLLKLHSDLGGDIGTVSSESDFVKFEYSSSESKFMNPNTDMAKVRERLKGNVNSDINYKITPTFTFDLNDNFQYIQSSNNNIKLNSLSENKLQFDLNKSIEYSYSNIQNQNGEYIYTAKEQKISFKVKIKEDKIGTFNFAENINILDTSTYKNYFEYNNFKGTVNKRPLETPTVIVKEQIKNINHGLYNGINDGQVSIQENNNGKPFEIAQGSTVTFGAKFTFSGSTDFKLNVDKNIQGVDKDNIKIYKVLNGGLVNIDDKEISGENNEFNISINVGNNTEILVVYQGKIIDGTASGQTLTNEIVFSSASKKVTIATPKQSTDSPILPDLF